MRNLALQGEVRHILPKPTTSDDNTLSDAPTSTKIIAVIQTNTTRNTDHLQFFHHDGENNNESPSNNNKLSLPPTSFVVTSNGYLLALNVNDELVWKVDLEKVVIDSEEDSDDEDDEANVGEAGDDYNDVVNNKERSQWFYGASFIQENIKDDDEDEIMGNLLNTSDEGLHVTCLSHAGHVVSVSIDATNALYCASNSTNLEEGSECIGSFDNGLECGMWSPDGEVLALVTFAVDEDVDDNEEIVKDKNDYDTRIPILMTMNTQYEVLSEVRLVPALVPLHHDSNSNNDDNHSNNNAITLCWRPDSTSLAISTMDAPSPTTSVNNNSNNNNKPIRRIRTYHRTTLQLLSLSKEEDGSGRDVPNLLPVPPTWAPAGCSHYVGAVQSSRPLGSIKKSSRARISMQVAFMEPNGLRHRECKIQNTLLDGKNDKEDVIGVAFNLEGDLLAVTSRVTVSPTTTGDDDSNPNQYGKVQLYHRNNYHWYLKYELRYDEDDSGSGRRNNAESSFSSSSVIVSHIQFSNDNPYQIMVALQHLHGGMLEWREYTFRWESSTIHYCHNHHHHETNKSSSSSVLAMSIDGKKLNFTPLDKAIVPPPMYASSLELHAPVVGITCRPNFYNQNVKDGQVEFIIATSDGKLALLHYPSSSSGDDKSSSDDQHHGVSFISNFRPPSLLTIVDPFNNSSSNALDEEETDDNSGLSSKLQQHNMSLRDVTIIDADDDDDDSLTVIAVSCPTSSQRGGGRRHQFIDVLVEMKISLSTHQTDDNDDGGSVVTTTKKADVVITSSLPLDNRALRIVNWSDTAYSAGARGKALLELVDGSILEYTKGGVLEPCIETGSFLEPCPWIAGAYDATTCGTNTSTTTSSEMTNGDDDDDESSSKRLVIGLSNRYRLYCGERLLSSASSSFVISLEHRFITHVTIGSQPQLRFLPIASLGEFDPLMGSDIDQNLALDGYEPRSVERGARLVAVFPSKPFVVLQMPRGNLESISPRALVLPYIMVKIQEGDFSTALDIMRRQRVDMNLIVDLDPINFLEQGGAEAFLGQIEKIDNLNLFLSSLIDVDTTQWKYPVPSWIGVDKSVPVVEKVNKVCTKMRQVMLDSEKDGVVTSSGKIVKEGHFLLPILSTFAKETPPKLEEALSLIKSNAPNDTSKKSSRKSALLSENVQSSIQYLAFLADYELLYNTAIGMYDFELAKAVARHSQMDPKVYLPMLKRWRELPEATARYEVDVKLKRYESALRHLVTSTQEGDETEDHFAKCLAFIEEHKLHKLGLELLKNNGSYHRSIMVSLGEHLLSERKPQEALTIFLASNPRHLDGGKRAAHACGDWRTYFACCAENGDAIDTDQVTAMAESVSSNVGNSMLVQREKYASAATILLDYVVDVSHAIDMLISAHLWSEGRRVASRHDRSDLIKKVVDGCVSYARTCVEDITERSLSFETANKRYAEVIVIRRDAIREAEEAGVDVLNHHDDSASMFSMQSTASNTSLRSSASGTSIGSVGSVGSVASVSTVISVGATSTFSFTGQVDSMKHKSKFNKIGRDKKKRAPKKKKGSGKMKPGSEEELKELVTTLTHSCPDEHFVDVIGETITFLLQCDKQSMATLLYESYIELQSVVEQSQTSRLERDHEEKVKREKEERKEGRVNECVEHPCEKDIDAIRCKPLQGSVESLFSYLL